MWSTGLEGKTNVSVWNIYELFLSALPVLSTENQSETWWSIDYCCAFQASQKARNICICHMWHLHIFSNLTSQLFQSTAAICLRLSLFSCGLSSLPLSGTCCGLRWFAQTNAASQLSHINSLSPDNFWHLSPSFSCKVCVWLMAEQEAALHPWGQCKTFWVVLGLKKALWRAGSACVWGAVAVVEELGPQWVNGVAGEHWLGGDGGPQHKAAPSQEGSRPLSKYLLDTDSPGQAVQGLCWWKILKFNFAPTCSHP